MGTPHVYTAILTPIVAKKLYTCLTKPKAPVVWDDEGGVSREIKLKDVSRSDLVKIELPKFCSGISVTVVDSCVPRHKLDLPSSCYLGGNDWLPPEFGEGNLGRFLVVVPELHFPIQVVFSKSSGERFSGKDHNSHSYLEVGYPTESSYMFKYRMSKLTFGERPPFDVQREYMDKLLKRFDFPSMDTPGVIQGEWDQIQGEPGASVVMTPESCDWFSGRLEAMIRQMVEESPSEYYLLYMTGSIGELTEYLGGERYNVRDFARDFLERIARENDFERYDIRYRDVGPCSWEKISKTKRKVKEPTVAQLGSITLEDGTVCMVSLTTHETGYQFFVEFACSDDLNKFLATDLCKQHPWSFIGDHPLI